MTLQQPRQLGLDRLAVDRFRLVLALLPDGRAAKFEAGLREDGTVGEDVAHASPLARLQRDAHRLQDVPMRRHQRDALLHQRLLREELARELVVLLAHALLRVAQVHAARAAQPQRLLVEADLPELGLVAQVLLQVLRDGQAASQRRRRRGAAYAD